MATFPLSFFIVPFLQVQAQEIHASQQKEKKVEAVVTFAKEEKIIKDETGKDRLYQKLEITAFIIPVTFIFPMVSIKNDLSHSGYCYFAYYYGYISRCICRGSQTYGFFV